MTKDQLATRSFWTAASMRAVRTFAQGILVVAGAGAVLFSASWLDILLSALGMALVSLLTSIVTGIPEAPSPQPVAEDPEPYPPEVPLPGVAPR
jgi:hypothetical protein